MVGGLFAILAVLLVIGVPICVGLLVPCILPILFMDGYPGTATALVRSIVGGMDNIAFIAIPCFMLSGAIMSRGDISRRLFQMFSYFLCKRTAGMPIAVMITCAFYGAICGSGPATTAAVGSMCIPILIKLGYDKEFSGTLCAAGGGIGIIIPPSIPFIMFGVLTNTSVGDLFKSGVAPGIVITVIISIYVYFYCKRKGEDKEKLKIEYEGLRKKGFRTIFNEGILALLCPVIILGGIYSGAFTPTEAAVVSVFYAVTICIFFLKTLKFRDLPGLLNEAIRSFVGIAFLLAIATAFMRALTYLDFADAILNFFTVCISDKYVFLLLVALIMLMVGMVMDAGPAMTILAPMLMYVVQSYNISMVQFGIMMSMCLCVGFISPPFGLNLFTAAPLCDSTASRIGKLSLPYCACYITAILIIIFIPQLTTFLL